MRTLISALIVSLSIPSVAQARLLQEIPNQSPPEASRTEPVKQIRVERGVNLGLVQELIVTCPSAEVGIISYSKAERVFCTADGCSENMATTLRDFCGLGGMSDVFAGR